MSEQHDDARVALSDVLQRLDLERQDLESRVGQVRGEFRKLGKRKLVLHDEWKKLRIQKAQLDDDKRRFRHARLSPWFQTNLLPTRDSQRVRINVGGQSFETTTAVLGKDPDSMLAAIAERVVGGEVSNGGLEDIGVESRSNTTGDVASFFVDRDWWLFRHILMFLREDILPQDRDLLSRMYREAEFYGLSILRDAIRSFLDPSRVVEKSCTIPCNAMPTLEHDMLTAARDRVFRASMTAKTTNSTTNTNSGDRELNPFLFGLTRSSLAVEKDFTSKPKSDWKTTPVDNMRGSNSSRSISARQHIDERISGRNSSERKSDASGGMARTWHAFNQIMFSDK